MTKSEAKRSTWRHANRAYRNNEQLENYRRYKNIFNDAFTKKANIYKDKL